MITKAEQALKYIITSIKIGNFDTNTAVIKAEEGLICIKKFEKKGK